LAFGLKIIKTLYNIGILHKGKFWGSTAKTGNFKPNHINPGGKNRDPTPKNREIKKPRF